MLSGAVAVGDQEVVFVKEQFYYEVFQFGVV